MLEKSSKSIQKFVGGLCSTENANCENFQCSGVRMEVSTGISMEIVQY